MGTPSFQTFAIHKLIMVTQFITGFGLCDLSTNYIYEACRSPLTLLILPEAIPQVWNTDLTVWHDSMSNVNLIFPIYYKGKLSTCLVKHQSQSKEHYQYSRNPGRWFVPAKPDYSDVRVTGSVRTDKEPPSLPPVVD